MKDVNAPPLVDFDKCIACAKCVGICPGLAIFVVKIINGKALVTLPYEFLPVPKVGKKVKALDRMGVVKDEGFVRKVVKKGRTMVITVEVRDDLAMDVRNIRVD
jgi:Fe-S-cluster-containing hydrogenase component 2